jgi:hypothetical protein
LLLSIAFGNKAAWNHPWNRKIKAVSRLGKMENTHYDHGGNTIEWMWQVKRNPGWDGH